MPYLQCVIYKARERMHYKVGSVDVLKFWTPPPRLCSTSLACLINHSGRDTTQLPEPLYQTSALQSHLLQNHDDCSDMKFGRGIQNARTQDITKARSKQRSGFPTFTLKSSGGIQVCSCVGVHDLLELIGVVGCLSRIPGNNLDHVGISSLGSEA